MIRSPGPGRLPLASVRLTDPFWTAWQRAFIEQGLEHQWQMCEQTGRLDNFRRAAAGGTHQGRVYDDSDVHKWAEAAAYAVALDPKAEVRARLDQTVETIVGAQAPDGYLMTPFQLGRQDERWAGLAGNHEMYCMGHLIEAGVAHAEATCDGRLLECGVRAAACIAGTFGPGLRHGYCGHQEIELALARLTWATGDERWRELGSWMIERRGRRPSPYETESGSATYRGLLAPEGEYDGAYCQDDRPLEEQNTAVGHAVRAMYYYCGALDCGPTEGQTSAMSTIWSNLVAKRMYVTGGIGSAGRNEGFTRDYDLPNREAYAETCAAVGLVMWAWRMAVLTGQAKFADVMELALYNAVLSGVSLDTTSYFYDNPLDSRGDRSRKAWFDCACCPPNVARLVLSVGRYAFSRLSDGLAIHVPVAGSVETSIGRVEIESEWPWSGDVCVTVVGEGQGTLALRCPGWASGAVLRGPDGEADPALDGYWRVTRHWRPGDRLELRVPIRAEWLSASPQVADCVGRAALRRGPLVYAVESPDVHLFLADPMNVLTEQTQVDPRRRIGLSVEGRTERFADGPLYAPFCRPTAEPSMIQAWPYFAWANAKPMAMAVWLRT
jgi:uncharacterized protein